MHNADASYKFELAGTDSPRVTQGTTDGFIGSHLIATSSAPSHLSLDASYDPSDGTSMQANMYWIPCSSSSKVVATHQFKHGHAHVTASWKPPAVDRAMLNHLRYDVSVRNGTEGDDFVVKVPDIDGTAHLAVFDLPLSCELQTVRVASRFVHNNGTSVAHCASPYPDVTIATAAASGERCAARRPPPAAPRRRPHLRAPPLSAR